MSDPRPRNPQQHRKGGKFLDQSTWDALKAAGYTDEQLYEDQPFGPIIYAYTRKQAIEDGVLVDLTRPGFGRLLPLVGIRVHTAITATAFAAAVTRHFDADHADEAIGRALVVLASFCKAARAHPGAGADRVYFTADGTDGQPVKLWAHIGPGDEGEPVLTIMLEGED
jgi:hypothetical protein